MIKTSLISIATTADVRELVELVNSAYRGESSKRGWTTEADLLDGIRTDEESMTQLINKAGSTVLKYRTEKGDLLACVNLQDQGEKLYLGLLTVSPLLQGGGIGKQLLKASEEFAKERQFKSVVMSVISIRSELIAWYERHGYARTGETKEFPSSDPRFGIPKRELQFIILKKEINQ